MRNEPAIAIIQARMSSSRLPGKVLMPLAGKPMIGHIYERASRCKYVNKVVVATSDEISDDPLVEYCEKNRMNVFRGSLNHVLSRYTDILESENHKYYVRITGDCPLIHPQFIDNQIAALRKYDGDLIWCDNIGHAFEGQGVHSTDSLFFISKHTSDPADLEHVGSIFLANNPHQFKIVELTLPPQLVVENLRLTVDQYNDYLMFSKLFEALWPALEWIELAAALQWLNENAKVASINKNTTHSLLNIELQEKRKQWRDIPKIGNWEYKEKV